LIPAEIGQRTSTKEKKKPKTPIKFRNSPIRKTRTHSSQIAVRTGSHWGKRWDDVKKKKKILIS